MRLSGPQLQEIVEISDGTDVTLTKKKDWGFVDVHRIEDGLRVRVFEDGTPLTLHKVEYDEEAKQ